VLHVPCRYLAADSGNGNDGDRITREAETPSKAARPSSSDGSTRLSGNWTARHPGSLQAHCLTHGHRGVVPARVRAPSRPAELGRNGKFPIVYKGAQRALELRLTRDVEKTPPVLHSPNPCVGAPCRTADNRRGAACCRDLSLEVVVPETDTHTAALLRARKSPYLCKVSRTSPEIIECEVISACGYLEDDGIGCALHDRRLPNGRPAKPSICSEWPDLGPDAAGHPGCRLL